MEINQITERTIGAAIRVHRELGPGLLESVYQTCLEYELLSDGLSVERECPVPFTYRGVRLECACRIDLLVEGKVVVEVKSVARLAQVHRAQVLSYLRLLGAQAGLLINFNVKLLMHGVERLVLNYPGPPPRAPRPPR